MTDATPRCETCPWFEKPKPLPIGRERPAELGPERGECSRFPHKVLKARDERCGEHPEFERLRDGRLVRQLADLLKGKR